MKKVPSVFFVGGFLGAGKTTAIMSLAKIFAQRGLKAAAITNDQTDELVDTFFLSGQGVPTEEVAGSCFCCNFKGLSDCIDHSIQSVNPDVILAEPVGSCTDIVATVIRPMRSLMADKVNVQSYSVLVEPDRWIELGDDAPGVSWSMKFLFDKQLQEADFIVITKLDTLGDDQARELMEHVQRLYPQSHVLGISSRAGIGLDPWLDSVQSTPPSENWLKEIDYHTYAEAEAEMGWLNAQVVVKLPSPTEGKTIAALLAEGFREEVGIRNGVIGHLKLLAVGDTGSIKAGLTQLGRAADLDGRFTGPLSELQVTVNMRATVSPGDLAEIVIASLARLKGTHGADTDIAYLNTFRPSPPNPTYRYAGE